MERLVYILAMVILTTMFISTLACPPSCKDTGDSCMPDRPPPPTLNDDQRQAVQNDMQRIMMFKNNPDLLRNKTNQAPIITLTDDQRRDALENYPSYFRSEASLPPIGGNNRQRRQTGARICEPTQAWEAISIAINGDGEVVQVVQQTDDDDSQQWFLTETCSTDESLISSDSCSEVSRYVSAYVVDLSTESYELKEDWIEIDCCAAFGGQ